MTTDFWKNIITGHKPRWVKIYRTHPPNRLPPPTHSVGGLKILDGVLLINNQAKSVRCHFWDVRTNALSGAWTCSLSEKCISYWITHSSPYIPIYNSFLEQYPVPYLRCTCALWEISKQGWRLQGYKRNILRNNQLDRLHKLTLLCLW